MPRIDYHDIGHLFPLADIVEDVCSKLSIFRGADLTDISVLRLLDQVHISKNSNRSDRFYRVTLSYVGGSPFSKRQQYHIPGRYPGVLFSYYLSEKDYLTSLITFEPLFG